MLQLFYSKWKRERDGGHRHFQRMMLKRKTKMYKPKNAITIFYLLLNRFNVE